MTKHWLTLLVLAFFLGFAVWALIRGDWLISLIALIGAVARVTRVLLASKTKSSE